MNIILQKLPLTLVAAPLLLCAMLAPSAARASPIVGNFSISGGDTFTSTQITFTNPALLLSSTLPGISGFLDNSTIQSVTMTSFLYANAPGTQLFMLTQNGVVVTFSIYQDTATYTPAAPATLTTPEVFNSLSIEGYGYLTESGYDLTSASFSITSSETGAISFQAVGNSPASPTIPGVAPEPSSLLLLGTGMLGVSVLLMRSRRVQV